MRQSIGIFLFAFTTIPRTLVSSFLVTYCPYHQRVSRVQVGFNFLPTSFSSSPSALLSSSSSNDDPLDTTLAIRVIDDVAKHCRVQPPTDYRSIAAVKHIARWTWRRRVAVLKLLHWNDPLTPVDSCINLECLWWKALSTTDPQSPCFDTFMTYDMLPHPSRWIVNNKVLRKLHPRWIHALLEVRMAYLNQAIDYEITRHITGSDTHYQYIRIISLGAGYDVRSMRMLNNNRHHPNLKSKLHCYEFDLPETIASKENLVQKRLLQRYQLRRRRRCNNNNNNNDDNNDNDDTFQTPTMIGIDLNDTAEFQRQLHLIITNSSTSGSNSDTDSIRPKSPNNKDWHTIFVIEGVLMYLEPTKAVEILQLCANVTTTTTTTGSASLCFADRLFEQSDCDPIPIQKQLDAVGWKLIEWAPSPTANAKHMGIAHLSSSCS